MEAAAQAPGSDYQNPILLFDGVCNLCNGFIQFVIKRDPEGVFRFAALQSETGKQLLQRAGYSSEELSTVVLHQQGRFYTHSDVALRVFRQLRFPWPLLYGFVIIPRPLRDAVYNWIARNRYRWFGRREECMMPTPDIQSRFLDA